MTKELFLLLTVQHVPADGIDIDNTDNEIMANIFYFVYNMPYSKLKRDEKIGIANHKNYFIEKVNEMLMANNTELFSEGWFAYNTGWASASAGILETGPFILIEPFSGTLEELETYLGYNNRKDVMYVFERLN